MLVVMWLLKLYNDAASLVWSSPPLRYGPLEAIMETYRIHGIEATTAAMLTS